MSSGVADLAHIAYVALNNVTSSPVSRAEVVRRINGGEYFYTNRGGVTVQVEVVPKSTFVTESYIKTKPDRTTIDNLLSLPPF